VAKLIRNAALWPASLRTEDQNSDTVPPSGTGNSIASNVIAMATTASEKKGQPLRRTRLGLHLVIGH
jgi:hypothetical protein